MDNNSKEKRSIQRNIDPAETKQSLSLLQTQVRKLVSKLTLTAEEFLSILVLEQWGLECSKQIIDLQRRVTMLLNVERYLVQDCGEQQ